MEPVVRRPWRGGAETPLAGADPVLVHDVDGRIEPHFLEIELQIARSGLDLNVLGDAIETLRHDIHPVRAGRNLWRRHGRHANVIAIDEDLCPGHVATD